MIRIYVLSSVVPEANSFGGPLVLHRYLSSFEYEVQVFRWQRFPFRTKVIGKLKQVGAKWFGRAIECIWPSLPSPALINRKIHEFRPDVILTVAHGWLYLAAKSAATRHGIPLLTFFDDWWPDFDEVPPQFKKLVESRIRATAAASAKIICVSQGMIEELGSPNTAVLLSPIPNVVSNSMQHINLSSLYRLVYFGNTSLYSDQLKGALGCFERRKDFRFHIYGQTPDWDALLVQHYRETGCLHGRIKDDDFDDLIIKYDAILVTMRFDLASKRRMSTSFLSKIVQGVQYGLPIIVWGPAYCSAVKWARKRDSAICVTSENPDELFAAFDRLVESGSNEYDAYRKKSLASAHDEFNPARIRAKFHNIILECITANKTI